MYRFLKCSLALVPKVTPSENPRSATSLNFIRELDCNSSQVMTVRIVGLINSQHTQMLNGWCTRKYKV